MLISICMCFSLLPGLIASADIKAPATTSKEDLQAVLPNGGHVLQYSTFSDGGNNYVKIDVGVFNVKEVQTYILKLKYDPEVVTPVIYNASNTGQNGTPVAQGTSSSSGITLKSFFDNASISPVALQSGTVTSDEDVKKLRWNQTGSTSSYQPLNAPFQFAAGTMVSTAMVDDKSYGTVSVEMTTQDDTAMQGILEAGHYKDGFIVQEHPTHLTFAQDECVNMYTLYFKKTEGKTVDNKTITIWSDDKNTEAPSGSALKKYYQGSSPEFVSSDAAIVSFPGEDVEYDTTIKVQDTVGSAIQGASVELRTTNEDSYIGTYTSNTAGVLTSGSNNYIPLKAGSYKYKATAVNFLEANGTIQVTGDGSILTITMQYASTAKYDVPVTVTDADTGAPVAGATVKLNGVAFEALTDPAGKATGTSSAGTFSLEVSKEGYQTLSDGSVSIVASADYKTATITGNNVSIVPTRTDVTISTPQDKEDHDPILLSNVVITKVSGGVTQAWGGSSDSENHTYSQEDVSAGSYTFHLPRGTSEGNMVYKIIASATGYESSDPYYMTIDQAGNISYFSDEGLHSPIGRLQLELVPYSEPLYSVIVYEPTTDPELNEDTVKVDVYLRNIKAFYGTFGIKYDSKIMHLEGFEYDDAVKSQIKDFKPWEEPDVAGQEVIAGLQNPVVGTDYHAFTWGSTGDNAGEPFDTLGKNVKIGTYTFKGEKGKELKDEINRSTFTVIEYDKTANGALAINHFGGASEASEFLKCYWRYTDNENGTTEDPEEELADGRLHHTLATSGGFYQAYASEVYVDGQVTPATGNKLYDVKTDIHYDFPIKSIARLQFDVRNEKSDWVEGAQIYIYRESDFHTDGAHKSTLNPGALPIFTLTTDSLGEAYRLIESSVTTKYGYRIVRNGYWDYPSETVGNTALGDLKVVSVLNDTITSESVTLQSKTYHDVVLKMSGTDGHDEEAEKYAVNLGADRAYNGTDYVFNIRPKPGYQFNRPAQLTFSIDGVEGTHTATFDTEKNAYVIKGTDITGLSDSMTEPDEYGFRAGDLTITLAFSDSTGSADINPSPADKTYTVTATAGTNGKVDYSTETDGDKTASGNADKMSATGPDSINVSGIKSGEHSGKFTFTADDGYLIDKVYINGSEAAGYRDLRSFSYQFTDIDSDRNITVTFGLDGGNGHSIDSEDTLLTVVVGDRGSLTISSPSTIQGTIPSNTSRTYLIQNAGDATTVMYGTQADQGYVKDKYYFNGVEWGTEAITVPKGKHSVLMVSFKLSSGPSFTVFVNAFVESGQGDIVPPGITSYSIGTCPRYDLTADNDLVVGGITVDGVMQDLTGNIKSYQHRMDPLTKNTDLGAIFSEVGYKVTGKIDLAEGKSTLTSGAQVDPPNTGAVVSFVRESDGYRAPSITTTNTARKIEFETELPIGSWTVTVSKDGYLDYIITEFEVTAKEDGQANEISPGTLYITPLIGDASHDKSYVTLEDVGLIANGLMTGSSPASKVRANVNDDLVTNVDDMYFAKRNYGAKATKITHAAFMALAVE